MKAIITVTKTARTNAIDQHWFAFEPTILGKKLGGGAYAGINGCFADDIEEAQRVARSLTSKYAR